MAERWHEWQVPSRKRVLKSNIKTTIFRTLGIIQVCGLTRGAREPLLELLMLEENIKTSPFLHSVVPVCWPCWQMLATSRQVQVKQEERMEVDLNKVSAKQAAKQLLLDGTFQLSHR